MRPRYAHAKLRAWSAAACGTMLALAVAGCLGEPFARLLAGGFFPPQGAPVPPNSQGSPPPTYTVSYRVGDLWDTFDSRLEIYDRRRWFWLDVRDPAGKPPLEPPAVSVQGPPGVTPPQVYEVQKDQSAGRFFVRVRFYDPGPGYRMAVWTKTPSGGIETAIFDLPAVQPALRQAGAFTLAYSATPSLGKPSVPAVLTVRAADGAGKGMPLEAAPRVRLVNPCGWGPYGTFSAVPGEAGAYAFEVPEDEIIDVTGNYKIKVYPLSDPASYVEYTYETR